MANFFFMTSVKIKSHNMKQQKAIFLDVLFFLSGGQELQKSSSSSTVLDRNNQFAQAKERKFTGSIERIDSSQILLRRDKSSTMSITRPR